MRRRKDELGLVRDIVFRLAQRIGQLEAKIDRLVGLIDVPPTDPSPPDHDPTPPAGTRDRDGAQMGSLLSPSHSLSLPSGSVSSLSSSSSSTQLIGSTEEKKEENTLTPRALGTNPRAVGTNPRALGTNPRALGTNPMARQGQTPTLFGTEPGTREEPPVSRPGVTDPGQAGPPRAPGAPAEPASQVVGVPVAKRGAKGANEARRGPAVETGTPAQPGSQKPTAPIEDLWKHWVDVMGSPRSVLDTNRRGRLVWALSMFSLETCKRAIDGCKSSAFHMGENDRKARYNGIGLIFRNAEQVERFVELADTSTGAREAEEDRFATDWDEWEGPKGTGAEGPEGVSAKAIAAALASKRGAACPV